MAGTDGHSQNTEDGDYRLTVTWNSGTPSTIANCGSRSTSSGSRSGSRSEPWRQDRQEEEPDEPDDKPTDTEVARRERQELLTKHKIEVCPEEGHEPVNAKYYKRVHDDRFRGRPVVESVDITGWVDKNHPTAICFPQKSGLLVLLDADGSPRPMVGLDTHQTNDGKTCATIEKRGTVVLVAEIRDPHANDWHSDIGGRVIRRENFYCRPQDTPPTLQRTEPEPPRTAPVRPTLDPPPQRLEQGMRVRVTVAGLRLRECPSLNCRRIAELARDNFLTVTGGPRTADGYVWWQVRTTTLEGWMAEGVTLAEGNYRYFLEPAPDDEATTQTVPQEEDESSIKQHNNTTFLAAYIDVTTDSEVGRKLWLEMCAVAKSGAAQGLGLTVINFDESLSHHHEDLKRVFDRMPQDEKWKPAEVKEKINKYFEDYYERRARSNPLPSAADIACKALDFVGVSHISRSIARNIASAMFYEDSYTDLPALHTEQQVEAAEERLKGWGLAVCDTLSSFGVSAVTTAKKKAMLDVYKASMEYLKGELKSYLKQEAAKAIVDSEQLTEKGKEFAAGLLATGLVIGDKAEEIPTGPCSFLDTLATVDSDIKESRYNLGDLVEEVVKEVEADIENLSQELLGKSTNCRVNTSFRAVPVRGQPDASENPVAKVAGVDLNPIGVVKKDGKKYFVFNGTLGVGWRVIGTEATVLGGKFVPSQTGLAFADADDMTVEEVEGVGVCDNLPDFTNVYTQYATLNPDSPLLDPNIIAVPTPKECNVRATQPHLICKRREFRYAAPSLSGECEYATGGDYEITKYVPGEHGWYGVEKTTNREGWFREGDQLSMIWGFFAGDYSREPYEYYDENNKPYTEEGSFGKQCFPVVEQPKEQQ